MNSFLSLVIVAFCCCLVSNPGVAETTPTEVYLQVLQVETEIDLIRLEMGVAKVDKSEIAVAGVQPREVYFQALTLFEKTNRLLFEQLRENEEPPNRLSTAIAPEDVLNIVNRTLELLLRVKRSFGIEETVAVVPPKKTQTPTDVFQLIIRLNRTLNTLLQRRFASPDVYQQLTYGVGLVSTILATVKSANRLGDEPALMRRKKPADVYRKLISIYTIIQQTMMLSSEQCMVIKIAEDERDRNDVTSGDVYDLTSLLVFELSYLHSLAPGALAARESYYPGDKLPSHVFQRAGRLESQMKALLGYVTTHPGWLENK